MPLSSAFTTRAAHDRAYASSRKIGSVTRYLPPASRQQPGACPIIALLLQPAWGRQILFFQERRVEQLRLVAGAGIGKDRHDRVARAEFACQADRAAHVDAAGAAEHQPFVHNKIE